MPSVKDGFTSGVVLSSSLSPAPFFISRDRRLIGSPRLLVFEVGDLGFGGSPNNSLSSDGVIWFHGPAFLAAC